MTPTNFQTAGPRTPAVGDIDIKYDGFDAMIVGVHPGGEVDLLYVDAGRRRFSNAVPRGLTPGCWEFAADVEAARPRTPLEEVAAARARGERVPEVGLLVLFGLNLSGQDIHISPIRARISRVHSLTLVDLVLYGEAPPDDPEEVEAQTGTHQRSLSASVASENIRKMGYWEAWDYVDGGLIKPYGPFERLDLFPPHKCGVCLRPARRVSRIYIDPAEGKTLPDPDCSACPECMVEINNLLKIAGPARVRA